MIALVFAILHLSAGASLHGLISSSDGNAPLVTAIIDAYGDDSATSAVHTHADSSGHYQLDRLSAGAYHLRVSCPGYETREMEVFVASTSAVEVNVSLQPETIRLADVRVLATSRDVQLGDSARALAERDVGAVTLTGAAIHDDPALASPDVMQSLAQRGAVVTRNETPTAMHVHGGSAGENEVLVDGIPLFNPYHASGTLSAIDPDIVSSATLRAGAPSAMFGDATAGVIDLSTSPFDGRSLTTQGGYTGRTFRESLAAPLPALGGSVLLSARRNLDAQLGDGHTGSERGLSFQDYFARATTHLYGGELEAFAFHSSDNLAFNATGEEFSADHVHRQSLTLASPAVDALSWGTGTEALRWSTTGDTRWELRAWRTHFDAAFGWTGTSTLSSSLEQLGSSVSAERRLLGMTMTAGVDARRTDVRYDVSQLSDTTGAALALRGAPYIVSAFAQSRLALGAHWSLAAGVRDALLAPAGSGVEPRLSLRYTPSQRLSIGVGYARLHQYVQSLRNEESLVDAIAGITLPVVSGSTANGMTVPVARSDELTATVDAQLTSGLALAAEAYTRRENGLTLVAPVTAMPFATTSFASGLERASGLSVSLEHTGHRVSGELNYTLASASRITGAYSYTPDFAAKQSLTLGVGVRVLPSTTLRAAASLGSGLPSSVYQGPLEWRPFTPASGSGDISGSPELLVGALNGSQLPSYARFDLGVSRDWKMSAFGVGAHFTASATVVNIFGRRNALGLTAPPDASAQMLLLPPRSLELGLQWRP